jgi:hypothetical protein
MATNRPGAGNRNADKSSALALALAVALAAGFAVPAVLFGGGSRSQPASKTAAITSGASFMAELYRDQIAAGFPIQISASS